MNLNLIAPINDLGYGVVGKHIAHELQKMIDVCLYPVAPPRLTDGDKCILNIQQALWNARSSPTLPDFSADCLRIWHQFEMGQMVGKGEHIGFPIFELDSFNERELHHLRSLDRIFVCSKWAKDIVTENIKYPNELFLDDDLQEKSHEGGKNWIKPYVDVVPLGVDGEVFYPMDGHPGDTTKFFTCGKTEVRKGHDILHKVFNRAFKPEDNVSLSIMWDNPFLDDDEKKEWEDYYLNTPLGQVGKIHFLPRVETATEVAWVMSQMDVGVFLSRAEGWNLEALEMMAMGKNIIITDYSAHTEFCNEDNSHLISIDETELAYDGKWFFEQGSWAKLGENQELQAIEHMQTLHQDKQQDMLVPNKEGCKTAQRLTWKNTAEKIAMLCH